MKKSIRNRKNKLVKSTTFFMALFVLAILVSSSTVPAAMHNNASSETKVRSLPFQEAKASIAKTADSAASSLYLVGQQKNMNPADRDVTWIYYDDGNNANAYTATGGGTFEQAIRLTSDELGDYGGYSITQIMNYIGYYGLSGTAIDYNIIIYGPGSSTQPGAIIHQEGPFSSVAGYGQFYTVELDTPVTVTPDSDMWVSIQFLNAPYPYTLYPAGVDGSPPVVGKSDWLYIGSWFEIGDTCNNMIRAGVEQTTLLDHDLKLKSIDAPVTGTAAQTIVPKATVKNVGNNTETNVPVKFTINGVTTYSEYSEGFEGATFPPAGWFTYIYGAYFEQASGTQSNGLSGSHSGTYGARAYCYGYGYSVQANTPSFDGSGGGNVLTFWHNQKNWAGDQDHLYIYASNDGGMSYYYVTYYGSDMGWTQETINLDNYLPPSNNMQIVFLCDLEYGWGVYLDDINVNGQTMSVVYTDTQQISSIAAGAEKQVSFNGWSPAEWGQSGYQNMNVSYSTEADVQLAGDQNTGNDMKTSSFHLYYPFLKDVEVTVIESPISDALAQTFDVKCKIKNVGQEPVKDFFTQVNIGTINVGATFLNADFSDYYCPPIGWGEDASTYWYLSYSNYAGGTSPEAQMYYWNGPYYNNGGKLYSNTFDTTAYTGARLSFKYYAYMFYTGASLHACVSTDGGATWKDVWSQDITATGKGEVTVNIPTSANTRIGFYEYYTSAYYDIYYWTLDDIKVEGTSITPEYQWDQAVVTYLNPGVEIEQTFQQWTPQKLTTPPYTSGVVSYGISASTQLSGDNNPANDIISAGFKLTYTHDIGVTITSPHRDGETFYAADALAYNLLSFDPTTPGTFHIIAPYSGNFLSAACWADGKWYVAAYQSGALYTVDPSTGVMTLIGGSVPDYSGYTGLAYFGGQMYGITWSGSGANLYAVDKDTGTSTLIGSCGYFLYIDMCIDGTGVCYGHDIIADQICKIDLGTGASTVLGPTGIYCNYAQGMSYDLSTSLGYLAAYTSEGELYTFDTTTGLATFIGAFQGGTEVDALAIPGSSHGAPSPTVYVQKGTTGTLSATGKNVGVWSETVDAYANMTEYVTNPNGTFVQEWNIPGVTMGPLGGTAAINIGTQTYALEGVYGLYVNLPLANDDHQSDNHKILGIGSDGTAPTTTYTITPASPDGLHGWYVHDVTLKFSATDPKVNGVSSGVQKIEYSLDGGAWTTYSGSLKVTTDSANHVVKYRATDKVGNVEAEKTVPVFKIDKTKPTIAMNYSYTKEGSHYNVIITVTATDAMSGMDHVSFYYNGQIEANVTGSGPTFVWNYTYAPLPTVIIKAIAYDQAGLNDFKTIVNPKDELSLNQQAAQQPSVNTLLMQK